MKNIVIIFVMCLLAVVMLFQMACESQSSGFVLPEGDSAAGKLSFVELNCNQCHSVADVPWAGMKEMNDIHVNLGGEVSGIKTYGELVTSVINPSHKIARKYQEEGMTVDGASRMRLYNEYMTVQDLIDIVTFLQKEYDVLPPPNPYLY